MLGVAVRPDPDDVGSIGRLHEGVVGVEGVRVPAERPKNLLQLAERLPTAAPVPAHCGPVEEGLRELAQGLPLPPPELQTARRGVLREELMELVVEVARESPRLLVLWLQFTAEPAHRLQGAVAVRRRQVAVRLVA